MVEIFRQSLVRESLGQGLIASQAELVMHLPDLRHLFGQPLGTDPLEFATDEPMVRGLYKVYFRGKVLEPGVSVLPLVRHNGRVVAVCAKVGEGSVYLFGCDMLRNRYASFARQMYVHGPGGVYGQGGGADVWLQPDNNVLQDNLALEIFRRVSPRYLLLMETGIATWPILGP